MQKRLPTPEKNAFFWQNVCEGHDNAYVGIFWKRLDYQKLTFQNGVFNEFMKNRSKKSGQNISGQFICEESKEYNPNEDKTKMRTVVVSCVNKFVNSTTTLYTNFIYSYPVEATVLNASPVIVVSSEFNDVTKISTKNIMDNLHKVKKVNNPISLLFNPMHVYASAGAGAAGDGSGAGAGSCGPGDSGAAAGSCGPGDSGTAGDGASGTGDSSGGVNGGGDVGGFFDPLPTPTCLNGATDYATCSVCPGGQLFSGGVCQNQTWTSYCTGPSDPNTWQVWQYDNGDSRSYRNTGASCDPTPSIGVVPSNINWGTGSTISWSSANTSSCTASGSWVGVKGTSDSEGTGNLTTAQSYGIFCTNGYGQNSSIVSAGVSVCSYSTPTWTGSSCVAPVGNITSNSCTIATNSSSCSMNVAWAVTNPPGAVEVRRPYAGNSVMATGATGNAPYVFPYQSSPFTLDLYDAHRNEKLDEGQFSATCALGGWDSISGTCVSPLVTSVAVTGQYYSSPGTISFTCSGSNNYTVRNTDTNTVVATGVYSGPRSVPVVTTGNYGVVCGYGAYLSNATVRYYNAPPPPPPVVSLISSPRTLVKDAQTTLTWDIQWPVTTCTITAKSVCTNGMCNAAQLASEAVLTTKLRTESTDASDPLGVRTISSSMRTIAPGHINTDWKALGRKTITVANTMDITIDCGSSRSATTRVQVTSSNEQ